MSANELYLDFPNTLRIGVWFDCSRNRGHGSKNVKARNSKALLEDFSDREWKLMNARLILGLCGLHRMDNRGSPDST